MTGLDRLREIASAVRGSVWANTDVQFCREHGLTVDNAGGRMGDELRSIAEQIENEQEERVTRRLEDREAAEWVRERGGLDTVRERWHGRVARAHVEHMAERQRERRERMQRHIECVQRLCRERRERIGELNEAIAEMRPRLMPEGMEWLRFDDGYPVRIGDEVTVTVHDEDGDFDRTLAIRSIKHKQDGVLLEGTKNEMVMLSRGERVKRPAPKVLDADGVEIRVGDTVWTLKYARELEVTGLYPEQDSCPVKVKEHKNGACIFSGVDPSDLTHRAPVLAADGKPLREGETVYLTDSPTAFVVDDIMTGEDGATVVHLKDGAWNLPQYLTHERPDSWERLEEDIASGFMDTGETVCDCREEAKDIVRRAKALAERDA